MSEKKRYFSEWCDEQNNKEKNDYYALLMMNKIDRALNREITKITPSYSISNGLIKVTYEER